MSVKPFFKKVAHAFKTPWVIALLVAALLIVLVWLAGPYISIAEKKIFQSAISKLIATIVIILCWSIFVIIHFSKRRKEELTDPGKAAECDKKVLDKQARRDEIKKIKSGIRSAIKTVTSSNFYGSRSRLRYALPWYLLIGTANSGKTSLLFNSGLQFPINEQADRHLYGLKATESCEFLYSNQAVFIDTPGMYAEAHPEHGVHQYWLTLLRGLFRSRTAKPLNGIIVCLSMRDIIGSDAAKREHLAKIIRSRLSEVLKKLHAYVPVYLIFTKCDAIPGFAEYFAHLSRAEREQIFGCPSGEAIMSSDSVKSELRELMYTLNAQIIAKVHQERDIAARGEMFRFPQELANLGPRIEDFIHEAFGPSRYHKPVMLRGFFFSSALSVKDVLASSAIGGELAFQQGFQSSLGDYAKGFFLLRLLQDLIIPEARLAMVNKGRRFNMLLQRYVPQLAALGFFLFAVFFLGVSFVNNYTAVSETSVAYRDFISTRQLVVRASGVKQILPELEHISAAYRVYDPEQDSILTYGFGLYQGDKVNAAASRAYIEDMNQRLLPLVRQDAANYLAASTLDMRDLKQALRAYLMLFQPERINPDFLMGWLQNMWSEKYRADAVTQQTLHSHINYLVHNGLEAGTPDSGKVAQARKLLLKTPLAQLAYQHMQEEAAESGNVPYTFRTAFAGSSTPFTGDTYQIPYMYTKKGFERFFVLRSREVIQSLADDSWIYGENAIKLSATDVQKLHVDVRAMYFRDYARHWAEALNSLRVAAPSSLADSSKRAEQFTIGVSPVIMVLTELRDNIYLGVDFKSIGMPFLAPPEDPDQPRLPIPPGMSPVEITLITDLNDDAVKLRQNFAAIDALLDEHGQPKPVLQAAHDQTARLNDYFLRLSMSENRAQKAFDTLVEIIAEHDNTLREAEIAAGRLPQPVGLWYYSVASDGLFEMMRIGARYVNDAYAEQVYQIYNSELRQFFPLNANSERDANIDEFANFFNPNGVLAQFQNKYIKHFTNSHGSLRTVMGRQLPLSQNALTQLNKATRVQNAFFSPKGDFGVNFLMEPVIMDDSLKRIDLTNGEESLSYWHGPVQAVNLNWPVGNNAAAIAAVQTTTMQGYTAHSSAKGEWALFRLLQQCKISKRQGNSCTVEIRQSEKTAQFRVQFRNRDNPLDRSVFSFSLPDTLY